MDDKNILRLDPNTRFGPPPKIEQPVIENEQFKRDLQDAMVRTIPQVAARNGCRLAKMAVNKAAPRTCERCGVFGPCSYGYGGVPTYVPEDKMATRQEDESKGVVGVIKSAEAFYDQKAATWGVLFAVWTNFPAEGEPIEDEFFLTFDQLKSALRQRIERLSELVNHPCVCTGTYTTIRLIL